MSVQGEITRLETAKAAIAEAITDKGVDVPADARLDDMAQLVAEIPVPDISGKADKAVPSAANNVALLDASGNLADSGKALTPAAIGAVPLAGGTMTGALIAASDTAPTTAKVRNSSLNATETTPTVNGEIAWTYA